MNINSFFHNGVEVKRCRRAKPKNGTAQLYCSQGGKSINGQLFILRDDGTIFDARGVRVK